MGSFKDYLNEKVEALTKKEKESYKRKIDNSPKTQKFIKDTVAYIDEQIEKSNDKEWKSFLRDIKKFVETRGWLTDGQRRAIRYWDEA